MINLAPLTAGGKLKLPCPTCDVGALKTTRDFADGYCDICRLTKHGPTGYDYHASQRNALPFRSEDDAYSEGIYDDD
jgi:hypothetical protein